MSRVAVRIEKLVVDGFTASDGQGIAGALQAELERILVDPTVLDRLVSLDGTPRIQAGSIGPMVHGEPSNVGIATARRIVGGVT